MGGEHSGVSDSDHRRHARDRLFHAGTDRPHRPGASLTSDARSRFERGVDPAFLDEGLAILTGLILDICGGEARRVSASDDPPVDQRDDRVSTSARTARSAASTFPRSGSATFSNASASRSSGNDVTVPTWRRDVEGPADLVEEVTRIVGYDKIPSTPLERAPGVAQPTATRSQLDRTAGAPHGCGARSRRGGDLELHLRRRGRRLRRRRLAAREPDQRGHEGDAALAAARA